MKSSYIPDNIGAIHFVGIGGIGMSGIAEVLLNMGYKVQGSDVANNSNTERLKAKDVPIFIGHEAKNISNKVGVLVYSSAVNFENPEIIEAKKREIPIIHRSEMLKELMRLKCTVSVSGTHGKTTTTSMIGCLFEVAGLDPTIINGGIIPLYGTNTKAGKSDWLITESDESDGSFLKLPATIAVATNIDPEHMEYYGSFDKVMQSYKQFVESVPFYGFGVLCIDHPNVRTLAAGIIERKIVTYGFAEDADVRAVNVTASSSGSTFDVIYASDESLNIKDVKLNMVGLHNVQNALAAISIGYKFLIKPEVIKNAVAKFEGVGRRFTLIGEARGVTIIDDYGHHPEEVKATLAAAKLFPKGHKIIIFQPHRYSRLKEFIDEFPAAFFDADVVAIAPIYSANEPEIDGINSNTLYSKVKAAYPNKTVFEIAKMDDIAKFVKENAQADDMVIFMGAGNITNYTKPTLQELLNDK